MIDRLIEFSLENKFIVVALWIGIAAWGFGCCVRRIEAGLFLVALAISAIVVPQLRLLHGLQALIYLAVVILARR